MNFPLLVKPLHFYKNQSEAPDWLRKADKQVQDADAYLFVSAEYNHSMPPALTNMVDHFPGSSFSWKPAGIVCYSPGIVSKFDFCTEIIKGSSDIDSVLDDCLLKGRSL